MKTTVDPPAGRRWLTMRWLRWFLVIAAPVVLVLGVLMALEERLVFIPMRYPDGEWDRQGRFEDAQFTASDGTKLHGWFATPQEPRVAIVFCHGNAGNLTHRSDILEVLPQLGAAALVFDYRGYGKSEGRPTEQGVLSDARAARQWLAQRLKIDERQIVLWGESLGGGVVVDLAASDGARGLILENTFTSAPDVAAIHFPYLPVRWLMRTRFDSLSKIARFKEPLLIVHGERDSMIPVQHAKRMYQAANEPKRLVIIEGGDHNDPRTPQLFRAVQEFLKSLPE